MCIRKQALRNEMPEQESQDRFHGVFVAHASGAEHHQRASRSSASLEPAAWAHYKINPLELMGFIWVVRFLIYLLCQWYRDMHSHTCATHTPATNTQGTKHTNTVKMPPLYSKWGINNDGWGPFIQSACSPQFTAIWHQACGYPILHFSSQSHPSFKNNSLLAPLI